MPLAYHSIKCTYASQYPQWASFTSTSQYHPIWTLPHEWKYIIGCHISIFPSKLPSLTLHVLTWLPTIACHQQYYSTSPIQLSVSYAIVLFACSTCICKVIYSTASHTQVHQITIFMALSSSQRIFMLNAHTKHHNMWYQVQNIHTLFSFVDAAHIDVFLTSHHNIITPTVNIYKIPLSIPQMYCIRALFYKLHADVPRGFFRV